MMTLEEAIKHCEEVTEENQKVVDTGIVFDDVTIGVLCCDDTEVINEHLANYQECADRHKQLAEWLKELKESRMVLDKMRAEIEALPKTYPFVNHFDMYVKEDDVKKIIDKYKAESEDGK